MPQVNEISWIFTSMKTLIILFIFLICFSSGSVGALSSSKIMMNKFFNFLV